MSYEVSCRPVTRVLQVSMRHRLRSIPFFNDLYLRMFLKRVFGGDLSIKNAYFSVVYPKQQCCQGHENHVYINAMHGHIASSVSRQRRCGNMDCPWYLVAPNGQQINVTLYDFAVVDTGKHPYIV